MTDRALEQKVLIALAKEFAEARRPVRTLIVLAACNAKTGNQQDGVITALVALKREGLVAQVLDSWSVTADGQWLAKRLDSGSSASKPDVPAEPIESGFKQPRKLRDTLRPMVGGAPRPVTRPIEQTPAPKAPATVKTEQSPAQPACHGCEANEGEFHSPECPVVNAFTAGRITGEGSGHALPPLAGDLPLEATVSLHHGHAIPKDLLERCAAMHLTLLAQAREAAAAGEPGAESELAWLYETGEQLLAAGGAH
ncbi:hypothetical protein HOP60_09860 [Halomonas daqingensis]|uniref:Uncharacterized protein n=1 Tax=Billgrantia desiderata TaxID=52021 RepID=A0ABS9B551_9GAMM|nr:hypothetical protein [Halomonas desiderata]MCE8042458.1 hypothetical protein [Halomonas desiderata]MCE8047033.1 hypothetical protein [Halomonas desiderata]